MTVLRRREPSGVTSLARWVPPELLADVQKHVHGMLVWIPSANKTAETRPDKELKKMERRVAIARRDACVLEMLRRQATIEEVARAHGVSIRTVSYIMTRHAFRRDEPEPPDPDQP